MDGKIMALINAEVTKLPQRRKKQKYKQYEAGKEKLCQMFSGGEEHEYICKAISKKYRV